MPPIHHDLFKSPLSDFQREVEAAGLQDRVHYWNGGERYNFEVSAERLAA